MPLWNRRVRLPGRAGSKTIGDTGLRAGTINLANFTNANEIKLFASRGDQRRRCDHQQRVAHVHFCPER